jgi:hypothetical protein
MWTMGAYFLCFLFTTFIIAGVGSVRVVRARPLLCYKRQAPSPGTRAGTSPAPQHASTFWMLISSKEVAFDCFVG